MDARIRNSRSQILAKIGNPNSRVTFRIWAVTAVQWSLNHDMCALRLVIYPLSGVDPELPVSHIAQLRWILAAEMV